MNRIMATSRNGCFEKINVHPVHTIPNHHPTKKDVLQKTFVQIILAANWLERHSRTSPNQLRRLLPSLLSLSFFYGVSILPVVLPPLPFPLTKKSDLWIFTGNLFV